MIVGFPNLGNAHVRTNPRNIVVLVYVYPLVICYIAIEAMVEIVDLHINSMVIFHSYVNLYQRGKSY